MTKGLKRFGYCFGTAQEDTLLSTKGQILKGHEFHHSAVRFAPKTDLSAHPAFAFATRRGKGIIETDGRTWDGMVKDCTLASYHHFHANTSDVWAKRFVTLAEEFAIHKQ